MHTPSSIATGSILLIIDLNKLPITKKFIANKFEVSEVTITKAFNKLEPYKDIITDDELTDKLSAELQKYKENRKIPEKLQKIYNNLLESEDDPNKNNIYPTNYKSFDINKNNINEYINNTDIAIYNMMIKTDKEYQNIKNTH
jgi:hemerythrin superfamily protein